MNGNIEINTNANWEEYAQLLLVIGRSTWGKVTSFQMLEPEKLYIDFICGLVTGVPDTEGEWLLENRHQLKIILFNPVLLGIDFNTYSTLRRYWYVKLHRLSTGEIEFSVPEGGDFTITVRAERVIFSEFLPLPYPTS